MLLANYEDDLQSLFFYKYAIALPNNDFVSVVHLLKFMVKLFSNNK